MWHDTSRSDGERVGSSVAEAEPPPNRQAHPGHAPSPLSLQPIVPHAEADPKAFNPALQSNQPQASPKSATSDSPFGPLSPGVADRVFPIRSVISVDPNSTPQGRSEGAGDGFPGMVPSSEHGGVSRHRGESVQYGASGHSTDQGSENTLSRAQKLHTDGQLPRGTSRSSPAGTEVRRGSEVAAGELERMGGTRQMNIASDKESVRSASVGSTRGSLHGGTILKSGGTSVISAIEDLGGIPTARFKHVVTEGGHAIITGRDGDTLQRCEDEPIHIPGAIQSFGLLIALHEESEGKLIVRVVSENSQRIIGFAPKQLFALDSFCDILTDEQADNLLDHLDFIRDEETDPATNGPEVFTMSIRSPKRKMQKLWCAMHINENNPDLVICEFELEDDPVNPLVPPDAPTPEPPEDTLQSNPTAEEYAESTVNSSRPLRVLRSARKRKGEAAAMEVFNIMSQVQEQLANAPNLDQFLKVLVGVVKELTGFHRVMVYQFDQSWNGRVVTELVDPRATKDLYKGLNFPASDIPKQARDLYKINKVRLLYDRDQETARLICRTVQDLETPVNLTYSYLRAMSPIHVKYLANMAVRASMSISINAFDELWGLIACHSYGSRGMRVSFPIRKMCRLVGDSASRNIERLSYASRLQARKLINTVPTEHNPSGYIIASSEDLLKLFNADYGLLSIRDETKIMGKLEQIQEALALLEYFRLRKLSSVMTSQDIQADFPDLRYPPGFTIIAGLLLVPLSVGGEDFIVFFRKGQLREVKWAGNPYEKYIKEGTEGYLEPRKSFKTWSETVVGKCREWTEEEIETAAVLCLVYGKFIEVWRQKEAALHSSNLTRILLANSAHEVRTPLNAIINYLEIALEGALDSETRENLSRSHSASKSLIYVINDLLDLTKTEEGNPVVKEDVFDFLETVREAAEVFRRDAKRRSINFQLVENPGVPKLVVGDQRAVRQIIMNITGNAFRYTTSGAIRVELWLAGVSENRVEIDIAISDTGVGMSTAKLDELFRHLEQVHIEADEGKLTSPSQPKNPIGLGLASVARIVRNMNGQLRLKSEEGKGSRFVVQLGFDLPPVVGQDERIEGVTAAGIGPPSDQPTTPPVTEGELLLVNKSAQKPNTISRAEVHRRNSGGSLHSMNSTHSIKSIQSAGSEKSDVDRLIDAIQEPVMVSKTPNKTDSSLPKRSNSRGSKAEQDFSMNSPRPGISRSMTAGSSSARPPTSLKHSSMETSGQAIVMDSGTPIRPIRMPEDPSQSSPIQNSEPQTVSRVLSDLPDEPTKRIKPPTANLFHVLVAEDDPINSKIIKKRLEKLGHAVFLTINGEECSSTYGEKSGSFDVVLMDMQVSTCRTGSLDTAKNGNQMPVVDGLTSTKMIRSYEKSHATDIISMRTAHHCRVPILAVSASLVEKERQTYVDAGFDGWILKPIDFKRLSVLMSGIVEEKTRKQCLYQPGKWERGGWFADFQPDLFSSSTKPSPLASVSSSPPASHPRYDEDPFSDPISKEQDRLDHLGTDAVHAKSEPTDIGPSGNLEYAGLKSSADKA